MVSKLLLNFAPLIIMALVIVLLVLWSRNFVKREIALIRAAEWWRRIIGLLIDMIPIMVVSIILSDSKLGGLNREEYFVILYSSYCFIFELLFYRTLGKVVTGTIVIEIESLDKPSIGQVLIRTISRLIPFEGFSFIDSRPRGWHDSLSGTAVVNKKELLTYKSKGKWQVSESKSSINPLLQLQKLPKGIYRLLIVGWLILPLIFCLLLGAYDFYYKFSEVIISLIVFAILYYILVRMGIWVYFGFQEDKKKPN